MRSSEVYKIMFVCYGNICRSVMAQCVMSDLVCRGGLSGKILADSSATSSEEIGNPIYPAAARKLREMGVPVLSHSARRLCADDYELFDVFVGMEESNCRAMRRILRGDPDGKVVRLLDFTERGRDIADPWWTGDFDRAYDDIFEGCMALLSSLDISR